MTAWLVAKHWLSHRHWWPSQIQVGSPLWEGERWIVVKYPLAFKGWILSWCIQTITTRNKWTKIWQVTWWTLRGYYTFSNNDVLCCNAPSIRLTKKHQLEDYVFNGNDGNRPTILDLAIMIIMTLGSSSTNFQQNKHPHHILCNQNICCLKPLFLQPKH